VQQEIKYIEKHKIINSQRLFSKIACLFAKTQDDQPQVLKYQLEIIVNPFLNEVQTETI
jgi:hypothetical protein